MKHNEEWGTGQIHVHQPIAEKLNRKAYSGGSGTVLGNGRLPGGFCLKLVTMLDEKDNVKPSFWQEARSVSLYTSVAGNIPGCAGCPVPAHYWIHEDDPLYKNFRPSDDQVLEDFISLFNVKPKQLREQGIDPRKYRYIPAELLKRIYNDFLLAEEARPLLEGAPELHKKIFDSRIKADILLIYPIREGGFSLDRLLDGISLQFEETCTVRRLIYQILSAILALYRCGLAHGDIKPGNIMRADKFHSDDRDDFFLTDMGSFHSGRMGSTSATECFFEFSDFRKWEEEIQNADDKNAAYCRQNERFIGEKGSRPAENQTPEELNSLLRRTLMDGYALAVTVCMLAVGKNQPLASVYVQGNNVWRKWRDKLISRAFRTLVCVDSLSIAKMEALREELRQEFASEEEDRSPRKPLKTYGKGAEVRFEVVSAREEKVQFCEFCGKISEGSIKIEYGYLTEQFNISGVFRPMLRCTQEAHSKLYGESVMEPVITALSNGGTFVNSIWYAPDDAETGTRCKDFSKYTPLSLEYLLSENKLDDTAVEEVLKLGSLLERQCRNSFVRKNFLILPYPRDIVKVDGKWILEPFFLARSEVNGEFSMTEYFKMLCGKENALTPQNWLDLIAYDEGVGILYDLIPDGMVPEVAAHIIQNRNIDVRERQGRATVRLGRALKKTQKFGPYLTDFR